MSLTLDSSPATCCMPTLPPSAAATKVGGRPKTGKKKKKRKCLENFEFAEHEYGWYAHRWAIWSTPGSSLLNAATKIAGSALLP